ncbi:hypothetical protein H6P81_001791 [Aristolochia fimbriata]|uniref:Uncharacterized protein n=1 Tax=Aristolochia fimbriata TaxID=158543 RepID=A0AAV7F865_ARIFI|nr:hypothetical protein H6P81_001791 [Aristolochia fimbriata]
MNVINGNYEGGKREEGDVAEDERGGRNPYRRGAGVIQLSTLPASGRRASIETDGRFRRGDEVASRKGCIVEMHDMTGVGIWNRARVFPCPLIG